MSVSWTDNRNRRRLRGSMLGVGRSRPGAVLTTSQKENRMRIPRVVPALFVLLIAGGATFGQQMSEKRDIAVFALSYARWGIPAGALSLVDEQTKEVFVNLGRFNVIGMSYRLESSGIEEFIAKIKEFKEKNVEIPETVRLGKQAFTEADFNRLVGSFIVVVPTLSYYRSERTDGGGFKVELQTTYTFIDVDRAEATDYFEISTRGSGETLPRAIRAAAEGIGPKLQFELRSIPAFRLRTGIIEVNRGSVLLEFGRNMGVQRGDEYAITETRILAGGHEVTDEVGLLIVKDVDEEISFAKVIYSSRRPQIGDQLKEIPRIGLDTAAYAHIIAGFSPAVGASGAGVTGVIGVRQSTSRGFFSLRPFVGVEIPFGITGGPGLSGLTANFYAGGELNWYVWRFQLAPAVALGVAGTVPLSEAESFSVSHAGGFIQATGSFLVSRDLKIGVEAGYAAWFGLHGARSYSGLLAGVAATYKY